jgi:cysteine desulfurase/selenocysteine lyase
LHLIITAGKTTTMTYNINKIRSDFPILQKEVNGKPLIYFDNGATTQKPKQVIDRIGKYYLEENSNVHRGVHTLSQEATNLFEGSREYIRRFINAEETKEIIFTKGTTESINLLATALKPWIVKGDEILVTAMEHHSNFVPWQQLCEERGARLKIVPIERNGELDMEFLSKMMNPYTKLLALTHVSNVLGTVNPVKEIIKIAKDKGVPVLLDGAQAIAHTKVDVQDLDCDFYVFSGHKAYAPMGTGVLYARYNWMRRLPPYQFGGEMIETVTFEKSTFNELPYKYEAGTPNVAGVLGLEAALRYINETGIDAIAQHEKELLKYAEEKISETEGVRIIGTAAEKAGALSFVVDGTHPYDIGMLLDKTGVAVRTGHHCAQPLIDFLGLPGTVRASFAMYNTFEEIDAFSEALTKIVKMLK